MHNHADDQRRSEGGAPQQFEDSHVGRRGGILLHQHLLHLSVHLAHVVSSEKEESLPDVIRRVSADGEVAGGGGTEGEEDELDEGRKHGYPTSQGGSSILGKVSEVKILVNNTDTDSITHP